MRGKRHGFVGHLPLSDSDADAGARHSTADQVCFIIVAGAEDESKTSSKKLSNRAAKMGRAIGDAPEDGNEAGANSHITTDQAERNRPPKVVAPQPSVLHNARRGGKCN